jgi:hypothetical protein
MVQEEEGDNLVKVVVEENVDGKGEIDSNI